MVSKEALLWVRQAACKLLFAGIAAKLAAFLGEIENNHALFLLFKDGSSQIISRLQKRIETVYKWT
jgi:hypothetical protein